MSQELLVLVDAGHGINTPGKRSPDDEREWTFNNKVVLALVNGLKKYAGVKIARLDDASGNTDPILGARTARANKLIKDHLDAKKGKAILISCHHNAATGRYSAVTGVETFYIDQTRLGYQQTVAARNAETIRINESKKLADLVNPAVVKAMGLRDRGVKRGNLHMVREANCPAILVEGGFMDGIQDIKVLRDDKKLAAQGQAIADAAAKYAGLSLTAASKPVAVAPSAKPVASDQLKGIGRVQILAGKLNLRDKPELTGKIIRELHKGNEFNVYEVKGMWYRLSATGWASIGSAGNLMKYTPHPKVEAPKPVVPAPKPQPAPTAKPKAKKTVHRVLADGKQLASFTDKDNALARAGEALDKGETDVQIKKVQI